MNSDDEIVRLLTEIRDNQREEMVFRKRSVEESIRLQRTGLRWYRIGLVFVVVLIASFLVYFRNKIFGQ
jgi:hypothetical protein